MDYFAKRWLAAVKQAWKPMRDWGYERRRRCLLKRGEHKGKVTFETNRSQSSLALESRTYN